MAVQILSLASGPLQQNNATIYPGSATLTTIVKNIRVVNKDSVPRAVNLYIKRAVASGDNNNRYLTPVAVVIPAGGLLIDDQEITMSPNDVITGDTNGVAPTVGIDFYISGIQR